MFFYLLFVNISDVIHILNVLYSLAQGIRSMEFIVNKRKEIKYSLLT